MAKRRLEAQRFAARQQTSRWLVVRALSARASQGVVEIAGRSFRCALGRTGRRAMKREGDGATPMGCFPLRHAFWRADRGLPPATGLGLRPIRAQDGWCDAVRDRNYNRRVAHPYPASAERMAREDQLYDVIVVLGYNDRPRQRGKGSAIFMHLARPGYLPTAGCVALTARDLRLVLRRVGPQTRFVVPA